MTSPDESGLARLSPAEALSKMKDEGYTYIDVRSAAAFAAGRPAGARNVPYGPDFAARVGESFSKDSPLVIGCRSGVTSVRAAHALLGAGFTRVVEQRAGWDGSRGTFGELLEPGWSRSSLPTEVG